MAEMSKIKGRFKTVPGNFYTPGVFSLVLSLSVPKPLSILWCSKNMMYCDSPPYTNNVVICIHITIVFINFEKKTMSMMCYSIIMCHDSFHEF